MPYPNGATYIREGFFAHKEVSFVGRPFPLEEADEHFRRLKAWGLTFLRFLVTWEAVEHSGPGQYDEAYLDYLWAVVKKAGEHGLALFIDPHEDVWSRFTGGDGAPGWTLEAVGFDLTRLAESGAAVVHQTHGDPFPRMIWPTNNHKLAAATMWTLFFGGNDFAPETKIDGEPAQDYLQRHYIAAIQKVAERLADFEHVLGYDTLNEPAVGYIALPTLEVAPWPLKIGPSPTPFQSMLLGAGFPQEVDLYELKATGPKKVGTQVVNPDGVSVWREGCEPIWRTNGVWDMVDGQPHLLRPDYFALTSASGLQPGLFLSVCEQVCGSHPSGRPGSDHLRGGRAREAAASLGRVRCGKHRLGPALVRCLRPDAQGFPSLVGRGFARSETGAHALGRPQKLRGTDRALQAPGAGGDGRRANRDRRDRRPLRFTGETRL